MQQSLAGAFFAALIGVFITTVSYTYLTSINNEHILAKRIAMMILKKESPIGLIAVSAAVGSLSAATAALTGRSLMLLFKK
jgi:ABC-type transporter Mla maintaining outer membrane lipid asymmetry permease subunit MlaE